uniref:Ig-like domain-containing protein n=1 Tax=Astatotilapia calliptera TaxID=8154 RepID=A0AAX7UFN4_ASTCA
MGATLLCELGLFLLCTLLCTGHTQADKLRATLTAGTTIIPVGGSVTLTCSVQSSDGWKYEWFRRTQTTSEGKIRDQQNRDIRVCEGGIYRCRGKRGNPAYYTDISYDVTIEITFSNKVVVKQQPNWPQIFRGETITLTCEVQEGGETTEWEYEWRGPSTPTQWTHNNDVTFRVSESSSGDYMCKSRRRDDLYSSTEWSEAFTLSASTVKPKAQLTTNSRDVPVAGKVTLNCSVNLSSEWKYFWYRGNKSSEPLTTQDAAPSDGQISVSQEGLYRCRAGRGNPVYYTDYSDPVNIDKNTEPGPENSSFLTPLIVGLVCGILLILLLLLCRFKLSKDSCFKRPQSKNQHSATNHMTKQDETQHISPVQVESEDVTYSLVELKNTTPRKKPKIPEESCVYSDVKIRPSTGKSDPATAHEMVYSGLKPGK